MSHGCGLSTSIDVQLTQESAGELSQLVVENLAGWRTFPAILQVGGIESRASSRILLALEEWLARSGRADLVVVPEYRLSSSPPTDETSDSSLVRAADQLLHGRRIDYALVTATSVGRSSLEVDTVIEVKTNYMCQAELKSRPLSACDQARGYAQRSKAKHSYVLYLIASAMGTPPPGRARDAGWGYFREKFEVVGEDGPINVPGVRVLGCYPRTAGADTVSWAQAFSARLWAGVLEHG